MSRRGGDSADKHHRYNQYCKITQWIEHHKDHGDPKYAEAISDLCLDSWLSPSRYPGLTFLYQTNKKIRKEFCEKVFTPDSREACEEFKRYILPDVFHSCEDFQKKDVGNILGYKYEIKSCDKHKVVFDNGMEIHALLAHNSYEPLSAKLKDIIKIYYVVKGEPPENGDSYRIQKSNHQKGRRSGEITGGNWNSSKFAWDESGLSAIIMSNANISGAYFIFQECLEYLNSLEEKTPIVKNLILCMWYLNSLPFGIITYIPVIFIIAWADPTESNNEVYKKLICIIIDGLQSSHTYSSSQRAQYISNLISISRSIGFNRADGISERAMANIHSVGERLKSETDLSAKEDIINEMFQHLYEASHIFDKTFPSLVDMGGRNEITSIIKCIFFLQAWAIQIFMISPGDQLDDDGSVNLLIKWFGTVIDSLGANADFLASTDAIFSKIPSILDGSTLLHMASGQASGQASEQVSGHAGTTFGGKRKTKGAINAAFNGSNKQQLKQNNQNSQYKSTPKSMKQYFN